MTRSSKLLAVAASLAVLVLVGVSIFAIGQDATSGDSSATASAKASTSVTGPYRSRPDLNPPRMNIKKSLAKAGNGKIFVGSKVSGAAIYAKDGEPIWFLPSRSIDFRTQEYRGKPVLTWFQAPTKGSGLKKNTLIIANRNYKVIKKLYPGNGFTADSHEFKLTPRGTAYVTIYDTQRRDLSPIGGERNAAVSNSIAQEFDIRTGKVVWQWKSLDHVPIKDTYVDKLRRPGNPFDYFHINSISDTPDGNVLISGRGTNAVYKVNRKTGRIMWTLGGKSSDFKMSKRAAFHQQHDGQLISGNKLSVFDNAASPTTTKKWAKQSRALVLKLNYKKKTAKLHREYFNPAKPLANQQANVQQLNSGNFFVGWGGVPLISEHLPGGKIVFDAELEGINSFYRAYRLPWSGKAPGKVAVVADKTAPGSTRLWISWNGDSSVRDWKILAGDSKASLEKVATRERAGFETATTVQTNKPFVKVQGLNASGKVIGRSALTAVE
ncbi:MAG: arylsulfotransferase family protein [Solirubrobacterales bacterium]